MSYGLFVTCKTSAFAWANKSCTSSSYPKQSTLVTTFQNLPALKKRAT
ncbi:hypothetical protein AALB_2891 [Agarivorans albus MKT 106]|uniref:Uncharacterized protein n=1 Tax=Agarivorans albus MKT 106 TaxID=1331007 RepID=R9PTQ1_AGAAL|nr:hypothetical protein AALB_2891 [Agarivorans albus MKT 106]